MKQVVVLENAGPQKIHNFASSISAAEGFSAPSSAVFGGDDLGQDMAATNINFRGRRINKLLATRGLEYATHMQQTSDGVLYFVEPETNSLSTWYSNGDGTPLFQDRRSNNEVRLRLRGLQQVDPVDMSPEGKNLSDLIDICYIADSTLTDVSGANRRDFLVASGCEILPEGDAFDKNKTYLAAPEWAHIVGDWRLDSESVYTTGALGAIKANTFNDRK